MDARELIAEGESQSGIKATIYKENIIINKNGNETYFRFSNDFDLGIKDKKVNVSMSGHFLTLVTEEGELFLFTLTVPGSLFVDVLKPSGDTKYFDSQFTCDETKIIALTDINTIQYFNTLPTSFIQEFSINLPQRIVSFRAVESNNIIKINYYNEDGNIESKCMFLPQVIDKNHDPHVVEVLKEAPEEFLSIFLPPSITCNIEEECECSSDNEEEEGEMQEGLEDTRIETPSLEKIIFDLRKKSQYLAEKEQELIERRNMLARETNELFLRGRQIKEREENAKLRSKQIFSRLQTLIEASDNGTKITTERERVNRAERTITNVNIPHINSNQDTIYTFRTGNFEQRLACIKTEIEKRSKH